LVPHSNHADVGTPLGANAPLIVPESNCTSLAEPVVTAGGAPTVRTVALVANLYPNEVEATLKMSLLHLPRAAEVTFTRVVQAWPANRFIAFTTKLAAPGLATLIPAHSLEAAGVAAITTVGGNRFVREAALGVALPELNTAS